MQAIPTRNFLLKQVEGDDGKKKDVIAKKGEAIEVTQSEFKKHYFSLKELKKKGK